MVSMNKLTAERRAQILGMMVEGVSIRAITRMTGVSKNTVVKLLADAGNACLDYQDQDAPQSALQAHSSRRNLELRLLEAEERSRREARPVWLRRRVDLDCA